MTNKFMIFYVLFSFLQKVCHKNNHAYNILKKLIDLKQLNTNILMISYVKYRNIVTYTVVFKNDCCFKEALVLKTHCYIKKHCYQQDKLFPSRNIVNFKNQLFSRNIITQKTHCYFKDFCLHQQQAGRSGERRCKKQLMIYSITH